jgi:SSS family solute:Na+ symporter
MKLRVTSAYEILEARLGLGVRMLGSCFFLALRLFWMSLVIFATADTVLVPILGLDASAVPWVCVVLGLVTVVYTSMGGLRAVVLTDVLQTLVLFGGGLLALGLITKEMGGVGQWWPDRWPEHWQEPVFWYDPNVRFTFVGAFLSAFTWWVCTAGSDQMAIQRYLATRDARAARQVLFTTLIANVVITLVLAAIGLALLAFFRARPEMLPAGQTIDGDADKLFPTFIVSALPQGISGLVIAGLLAAAMSSLSSGLNSACSVVTTDFINRFRRRKGTETDHVRLAKYVSLVIGVVVVTLGTLVGQVEGSLLELCYKIANLLVAPLFLLFFLAMFVRWATPLGAYAGAICSALTAVAFAFPELVFMAVGVFGGELVFGLDEEQAKKMFVWMMPVSFIVGAVIGAWASLIPTGFDADRYRKAED